MELSEALYGQIKDEYPLEERDELIAVTNLALETLRRDDRAMLTTRFVTGKSLREISAETNYPLSVVQECYLSSMQNLRMKVTELLYPEGAED